MQLQTSTLSQPARVLVARATVVVRRIHAQFPINAAFSGNWPLPRNREVAGRCWHSTIADNKKRGACV